jgi:hypothetical protein
MARNFQISVINVLFKFPILLLYLGEKSEKIAHKDIKLFYVNIRNSIVRTRIIQHEIRISHYLK